MKVRPSPGGRTRTQQPSNSRVTRGCYLWIRFRWDIECVLSFHTGSLCASSLNPGFIQFDWKSSETRLFLGGVAQHSHPWLQNDFLTQHPPARGQDLKEVLPNGLTTGRCSCSRGMLQASRSLPTGAFCLELVSSVLWTCPAICQGYAMVLVAIYCLWVNIFACGWARIRGFADAGKPWCFVLMFCFSGWAQCLGCPLVCIPLCTLRVTEAWREGQECCAI